MATTRPKELIYFSFLPTVTAEGTYYMYYALDDYSQFLFQFGLTDDFSEDSFLQHIKKLMKHKDFKKHPKKPFTLMCNSGNKFQHKINAIINPHKGTLKIDVDTVILKTQPVVDFLNNAINKS